MAGYLRDHGASVVGLDWSPQMCLIGLRQASVPTAAADMTALPIRSGSLAGIVCLYAVIHLDTSARARAYAEFARVVNPGGCVLIAFHCSDVETPVGGSVHVDTMWDHAVDLTFHYLDPAVEMELITAAGLDVIARLDREPHRDVEHASRRGYLLARRPELTGS